ncbi:hypothetical protein [Mycolicibacterium phocaicum]|jgi:uncharacterized membrane protein YdjX (TVP38/TMEM64 family)|uniref:hypothetical protein n=1 Tax=Mycolicibacterium phocaicum TaxID=319706 RepID=UPI0011D30AD0|nr:hypothetical protein [Mycolicibacterium phocaicum]TXH15954.1 MAG: hypothetical protein E6R06_31930 [Mycobacterium sp.]UCZ58728.1 hypothetical protein LHJ73_18310 [Mycolicibacterium phocaicum]
MGAAVITAVGTVAVGLLVFLAQRLAARDALGNMVRLAELLEKLPAGEGRTRAVVSDELFHAAVDFHAEQSGYRATQTGRAVVSLYLVASTVGLLCTYLLQYFDLGKFRGLLLLVVSVVCLLMIVAAVVLVFDRLRSRRRRKIAGAVDSGSAVDNDAESFVQESVD